MNLLAIDTATEKLSVALAAGETTWLFEAGCLRHSELLMDAVDTLMKKAALKPEDLDGVLCMGGPGSFTGLRIGFAAAKGIALSLSIPFVPVPTLDCMARPFAALPFIIVPVIDAKRKAFFCALYRGGEKLCADMDGQPAEILTALTAVNTNASGPDAKMPNGVLLVGPGAEMLMEKLTEGDYSLPLEIIAAKELKWGSAETLIVTAKEKKIINGNSNSNYINSGPLYIRKSDAEEALGRGDFRIITK